MTGSESAGRSLRLAETAQMWASRASPDSESTVAPFGQVERVEGSWPALPATACQGSGEQRITDTSF